MKVKDLLDKEVEDFDTGEGWGKGHTYWLKKMGFEVLDRRPGPYDNWTNGHIQDFFDLKFEGKKYKLKVDGNRYNWDHQQIENLLDTEIEVIDN